MKVLVACEFSGVVRDAFIAKGHDAVSCDLVESETPGPHIQADIFAALKRTGRWDAIIAFPPCTDLSCAGAQYWPAKQADGTQGRAIDFVLRLFDSDCEKIAIENPTGILSTVWRKPDQIINPFQFGDPFKKRTCFWLKRLPVLKPTNVVEPQYHLTSSSTRGGPRADGSRRKSKLPVFKAWNSAKDRARTFQGIADAMAEQWGCA